MPLTPGHLATIKNRLLHVESTLQGSEMDGITPKDLPKLNAVISNLESNVTKDVLNANVLAIFIKYPNLGMMENGSNIMSMYAAEESWADRSKYRHKETFQGVLHKAYGIDKMVAEAGGKFGASRSQAHLKAFEQFRKECRRNGTAPLYADNIFAIEDMAATQQYLYGSIFNLRNIYNELSKEKNVEQNTIKFLAELKGTVSAIETLQDNISHLQDHNFYKKESSLSSYFPSFFKSSQKKREDSLIQDVHAYNKYAVHQLSSINSDSTAIANTMKELSMLMAEFVSETITTDQYFAKVSGLYEKNITAAEKNGEKVATVLLKELQKELPSHYHSVAMSIASTDRPALSDPRPKL